MKLAGIWEEPILGNETSRRASFKWIKYEMQVLIFWFPWWFLNSSWISGVWLFPVENILNATVWFLILKLCLKIGKMAILGGKCWKVMICVIKIPFSQVLQGELMDTEETLHFFPIFSLFRSFISLEIWVFSGLNIRFGCLVWKQKGAAGMFGITQKLGSWVPSTHARIGNSQAAGMGKSFWITSQ